MGYSNYFNFKAFNEEEYLITNDTGKHLFLSHSEFEALITNTFESNQELSNKLEQTSFVTTGNREIFVEKVAKEVRHFKENLFQGPALHIFVLTTQCNQRCIYCQASVKEKGLVMDKETARKAVDLAMQSPSNYLTFEFQGGEPLMNFEVIQFIIEYSEKNKESRNIQYNLVSNLTLLTQEMLEFFANYDVNISTSLDGDEILHSMNRPFKDGSTYKDIITNINMANEQLSQRVGAIQTTTRKSLQKEKDIINQYVKIGMESIFLRPLTPLGFAEKSWEKIGYTPEEFLDFYRRSLEYIIYLNVTKGIRILEGHAAIFLRKILTLRAGSYTELCSPCGAVRLQLAYYCDGNIYTCDEGRMLAEMGNDAFKVGTVEDSYEKIVTGKVCETMCIASCLENIPGCEECVYNPYCGTCPVINLAMYDSIFTGRYEDYKCKIYKGMLDIIFEYIRQNNGDVIRLFNQWAN